MDLMTNRLLFAEDLNVHENMEVRILKYWVLASSPPALYPATLPGHLNYADAANAAVQCSPQYHYSYLRPQDPKTQTNGVILAYLPTLTI